jgi:ElaB/YqjD/DUF883 family membrane-anchored ribosome-binding protein
MSAKSNERGARMGHSDDRSRTQGLADEAQEQLGELGEAARDKAAELQRSLEARIRQEPLKAVLIAAGVGIALGLLLRR